MVLDEWEILQRVMRARFENAEVRVEVLANGEHLVTLRNSNRVIGLMLVDALTDFDRYAERVVEMFRAAIIRDWCAS